MSTLSGSLAQQDCLSKSAHCCCSFSVGCKDRWKKPAKVTNQLSHSFHRCCSVYRATFSSLIKWSLLTLVQASISAKSKGDNFAHISWFQQQENILVEPLEWIGLWTEAGRPHSATRDFASLGLGIPRNPGNPTGLRNALHGWWNPTPPPLIGGQLLHGANFTTLQVAGVRQGYYLEFGSFFAFIIGYAQDFHRRVMHGKQNISTQCKMGVKLVLASVPRLEIPTPPRICVTH